MKSLPMNMNCLISVILVNSVVKPGTDFFMDDFNLLFFTDYENDLEARAQRVGVTVDNMRSALSAR